MDLSLSRRMFLFVTGGYAVRHLAACGGESSGTTAALGEKGDSGALGTEDAGFGPTFTGKYRYQTPQLFQPGRLAEASTLPGNAPFDWQTSGASYHYVDRVNGWTWDHPGGDWIDAKGVRQGTEPVFVANVADADTVLRADVTEALRVIQTADRWNAFVLKATRALTIASHLSTGVEAPAMEVLYEDGTEATLRCVYVSTITTATVYCLADKPTNAFPAFVEFERPKGPVKSATMKATITRKSGASTISAFIVDPPLNHEPSVLGLAAKYGALDEGLDKDASVFGVHRYLDGTTLDDFAMRNLGSMANIGAERNFDPAIFGTGPTDTRKFPHYGLGKWIGADKFTLVDSRYAREGFEPLVPGLGALRVFMPAEVTSTGQIVGSSGTLGAHAKLFLPEPDFGRLKRIFVRYYMRLGTPYHTPFSKRYEVYHSTDADWTTMGGKTGICPAHETSYGGVSGTSGGGYGWQMRLAWQDCDIERGGPNENAVGLGLHTYDFLQRNPIQYGVKDEPKEARFGQRGGLGAVIYPAKWYCIEMEVDLNSVSTEAPGYSEDGAVRVWIDGRLAYERTGMVMRSLPLVSAEYKPDVLRPARELGHRDLWFNWFHGGKTRNSIDRTLFVTGLAWSRSYIGPMRMG